MKKSYLLILIILVFSALTGRVARLLEDKYIDKDGVIYIRMAEKVADGDFEEAYAILPRTPPLYIWLMALSKTYFGIKTETAGRIISLISGTLLILPVFHIARRLAGTKAALAAAFLIASHPYLIRDSTEALRDSLFFLIFSSTIAFAIEASISENFSRLWYLVGIFTGLSVLTRSEGNELILACAIWILWQFFAYIKKENLKVSIQKTLPTTIAVIAGFMLIVVPAQIHLQKYGSDWLPADKRIVGFLDSFITIYDEHKINGFAQ